MYMYIYIYIYRHILVCIYTYRRLVRPYAIELKLLVHEAKPNTYIPPSALTCHISTLMETHKQKKRVGGGLMQLGRGGTERDASGSESVMNNVNLLGPGRRSTLSLLKQKHRLDIAGSALLDRLLALFTLHTALIQP